MKNYNTNKFTFIDLTPDNTIFYKGIAILMIVMHNFFHWLPPKMGENEQDFNSLRFETYLEIIFNQPEFFFQATFSFFGHYGVQIFLFLSAYGLTKKYINSKILYRDFLKKRILKIYPAFLLSIIFWAVYTGFNYGGPINVIICYWKPLLAKVTLISNFIPGQLYALNGPWWFVSLIIQFYIIFPLMLYIYRKYNNIGLISLSFVSLILTFYLQPIVNIPLPGTILTHIPELCMGLFLAREKNFTINYVIILIVVIIFILSNLFHFFWLFSYLSSLILLLIVLQKIVLICSKTIKKYILFIGSTSMYIFYINGFMRSPWIGFAKDFDLWYLNILICLIFILIVISTSFLMIFFSNKVKQKICRLLN